ncbi:GspH/FimT family pseudopilin [Pseudomonas sp. 2FE]|uniref:GspH/FimT family pseudopilin n=1 Tax=Pseudomonas sp. 2FE TaxID=2502190 RepID=UPI0010F7C0F3|nr:GspH/FimT family pseudopilin [Pseudomonas sp. 2FE]
MPILTRGFTLIEALVALAIIAILLGLGVPALTRLIHGQQLQTANHSLLAVFAYARGESIKRRCPVLIAAIDGQWENGWRVFADPNSNGQLDDAEPLLLVAAAPPAGVVIHGNTPVRHYIRYTPTGSAKMQSGAFQAGTLTLCHADEQQAIKRLVLSATGRLRSSRGQPGGC